MRTATPNRDQVWHLTRVAETLATIPVPNTTGLWGTTAPVRITLNQGAQTLRLTAPYQRGIAIRWLELKIVGKTK